MSRTVPAYRRVIAKTVSSRRQTSAVTAGLQQWIQSRSGYAGAIISGVEKPAGAGLSNETFLFECVTAERHEALVMQVGPAGHGLFRDYDLSVMARVQQRLAECSTVPVPPIRWFESNPTFFGAPFYVMGRVVGQVPSDNPAYHAAGWFADLPVAAQARAWCSGISALTRLHALDPVADGFEFLCEAPWGMPLGAEPARVRVAQWRAFLAWGSRTPLAIIDNALHALEATAPPRPARLTVCWGDAKISNCVIRDEAVVALLDWELCGVSDCHEDLAHWLLLDWAHWRAQGVPRLPGLPSPRETVASYELQAGHSMPHILWWFKLSLVRLAIIYHRFLERRIDLGRLDPASDLVAGNPMCALLDEALAMKALP